MDDFPNSAEDLVFRSDAIAQGITDETLSREVRNGLKRRVWRGAYLPTAPAAQGMTPTQHYAAELALYRAAVIAAARNGGPNRIVSHVSAAVLQGIELFEPDLSKVHFTSAASGKSTKRGVIHEATLKDSEIVVGDDGIPTTVAARSVCDTARYGTRTQAVCAIDSAIQSGVARNEIDEQVGRLYRFHGAPTLRAAMKLVDGRAESVGESVSRLVLAANPLIPAPDLQVEIWIDLGGRRLVHSDFGWRDGNGVLRVVGEFDGRLKYHRLSPFGDRLPEDVIYHEKLREDAIRATGPKFVRWTYGDAMRPKILHAKVISALREGGIIA